MHQPVPVALAAVLLPKVWGGDRLARCGLPVEVGARVGEAWMVADLAATSASGAGGQAVVSTVAAGALDGRTLRELALAWGRGLLGSARSPSGELPILCKLLDAREHLSVQVHPSPAYAAQHPTAHLKTECWYVLDALPGAELFLGVVPGTNIEALRTAAAAGTLTDLLVRVPAQPGSCYLLPSGLIHALGAGVLVAEIQTPSDTTYRVYDWNAEYHRAPREMHLERALAACDLEAVAVVRRREAGQHRAIVAETAYFTVESVRLPAGGVLALQGDLPIVVLLTEGTAALRYDGRSTPCAAARAVLVPASCAPGSVLAAGAEGATALVVRVAGQAD